MFCFLDGAWAGALLAALSAGWVAKRATQAGKGETDVFLSTGVATSAVVVAVGFFGVLAFVFAGNWADGD